MDDFEDDDLDEEINDILSQIRNREKIPQTPSTPREPLEKKDMEDFIIQNAASVVRDSVEMVENLKRSVSASAEPEIINAMSALLGSTTRAIDSLTKLKIAEDKNRTQKEVSQMQIDGKQKKDDDNNKGFLISREEVIKALMEKKNEDSPKIDPITVDI